MKDFIAQQIDRMQSIEEKKLLKDLLNTVFFELYETCEARYQQLEQRLREEIPLDRSQYTIYTTVLERSAADESHAYLFPMDETDVLPEERTDKELQQGLDQAGFFRAFPVFYTADTAACRALLDKQHTFRGTVQSPTETVPAQFVLRKAQRYSHKIEKLYHLFHVCDLTWQTVNAPYIGKFFDVCCLGTQGGQPLPRGGRITFEVNFEQYAPDIRRDLIPVWNVRRHKAKADDFPMPLEDRMSFEYRFDLSKLGLDNGYLIDSDGAFVSDAKRVGEQLRVVSPIERNLTWNLYVVAKQKEVKTDRYVYPIMSNRADDTFAGRLASYHGAVINTKGEIYRILDSYRLEEYIKHRDIQLLDGLVHGDSYDMNAFIQDEIRAPDSKKTLLITFEEVQKDYFLNRDLVSFLASQIQLLYPEYNCTGALV